MYRTCFCFAVFAVLLWSSPVAQSGPEALRARIEALRASPSRSIAGRRLFNVGVVTQFLESRGFAAPWSPEAIVYWTVSSGASGEVHFARDVYGRDAAVLRALNPAPVPSTRR